MNYPPRPESQFQERFVLPALDHAALTQTTTVKMWKCPAGRTFRVDRILYINPTGLAADTANAYSLEVKNGSTLMSLVFNTDSNDAVAGAALAADTFVELTADASIVSRLLEGGDILSAVFTEDGTQTLPAGRLVIEGRFIV